MGFHERNLRKRDPTTRVPVIPGQSPSNLAGEQRGKLIPRSDAASRSVVDMKRMNIIVKYRIRAPGVATSRAKSRAMPTSTVNSISYVPCLPGTRFHGNDFHGGGILIHNFS